MNRLSLRLRVGLFFALLALVGLGAQALPRALGAAAFLALLGGVWWLFDRNLARPLEHLAQGLRARAACDLGAGLAHRGMKYLGDLAPAAEAVAQVLGAQQDALARDVAAKTADLAADLSRLSELVETLPQGLICCAEDHRVLAYSAGARAVCGPELALDRPFSAPPTAQKIPLTQGYALHLPAERCGPLTYDFALLTPPEARPLARQTFVVFDCETTGLSIAEDEIVQLAAVRIVNGRRVASEVFDTLVNPHRAIPPRATSIHHITDAMVAGAPSIARAGAAFHDFARGAILVAHNARFDMGFLQRKALAIGRNFVHPVLDTLHLSKLVYGPKARHSLDALTARLGITIAPERRHTALGDAEATAEALLRLLPALQATGRDKLSDLIDRSAP